MSNWISSSRRAPNLIYTKLLQINSLLILTVNPVYWMGIASQLLPKMVGTHPRPGCAHHTGTGSLLRPATGTGQSLQISGASVLCLLWLPLKCSHARFSGPYLSFKRFINHMLTLTLWTECCVLLSVLVLPLGYMQPLRKSAALK